ncbi:MAG: translation initiation factor IF-1 [Candidatus Pacebacteria bacterium]|jgi:translation initiation factor IF-1|nr:translation initiation factor IF-1 [Candidatus Paceibacterota bacterium]
MDQQEQDNSKEDLVLGTVEEALPNALFRVIRDDTNESQIAYLAGKMRRFRIRVLVGDRVGMVIDPYGGKARISKRM